MTAQLIDGKALAARLRGGLRTRAEALAKQGVPPTLAVVLVGDDAASALYVRNKVRACEACGIRSRLVTLPADTSQAALIAVLTELRLDEAVHGVLVQLPLPPHIETRPVLEAIPVDKDVDGFHLYNVGALAVGASVFPPCTPFGVLRLLQEIGVHVAGRNVVIVGASNIVGKPMALMLLQQDATVSVCHAATRDLAQHTVLADVLIVAAGCPGLIQGPMVRRGAVVIDVGINRLPDGRIAGDVDFDSVRERAAWLTPVPGGVGPMTVTMLMENTLRSAARVAGMTGIVNADNVHRAAVVSLDRSIA